MKSQGNVITILINFFLNMVFMRSGYDNFVYILKRNEAVILPLLIYVDDILMENSRKEEISKPMEILNG